MYRTQTGGRSVDGLLNHQFNFREMCCILEVPDGEELVRRVVRGPRLWGGHALFTPFVTFPNPCRIVKTLISFPDVNATPDSDPDFTHRNIAYTCTLFLA